MIASSFIILLLSQIYGAVANTEKAIFLGPPSLTIPTNRPSLEDLKLEALSPQEWATRTHIGAEFPTNSSKYGESSWMLLHQLHEGQRYEVRICWAATQPTSFRLDTYELQEVFETPELITSLAHYADSRQSKIPKGDDFDLASKHVYDQVSSMLFLHIQAAADYYTMNQPLMKQVLPVHVDIILDPFLLNAVPRSLLPTVVYIILVALGSWFLSKYIAQWTHLVLAFRSNEEKKNL